MSQWGTNQDIQMRKKMKSRIFFLVKNEPFEGQNECD